MGLTTYGGAGDEYGATGDTYGPVADVIADPDFTDPDQFEPHATEGVDSIGNVWTLQDDAVLVATDPVIPLPPNIDLDNGGSRIDRFGYTLLDPDFNVLGTVDPIVTIDGRTVAPEVDTSIDGNTNRRLNNLHLLPEQAEPLDPRTVRVAPAWVDQDGTEYPLGIYRLLDATTVQFSGGDDIETTWGDESSAHHTPNTRSLSWGRGYPIADIIERAATLAPRCSHARSAGSDRQYAVVRCLPLGRQARRDAAGQMRRQ